MTTFDTDLLPPQYEEVDARPPYRPVWRTAAYETVVLVVGALAVNLSVSLFDIQLDAPQRPLVTAILALAPVGLWLLFSWRGEHHVLHPREGLLATLVISALVANAVAAPFIEEFIEPDRWLNTAPGLTRLLGYAVTVGLTVEFLKYLILRYTVWPRRFRRRIDSMAYSLAVSLAFATVFNLRFALLEAGAAGDWLGGELPLDAVQVWQRKRLFAGA